MKETDREIKETNHALLGMLGELTFDNSETKEAIEALMKVFGEM